VPFDNDDDGMRARTEAELAAQGLTLRIRDPTVLAEIAAQLRAVDLHTRERRLAAIRRELSQTQLTIRLVDDDDTEEP
jgi:hypothetical protein